MSRGVVVFFDVKSCFKNKNDVRENKILASNLIQTLRGIKKIEKKCHLHAFVRFGDWFVDSDVKLATVLDRDECRYIKGLIVGNPVARYFDFLNCDGLVQHQGEPALALTAACQFKSGVISINQGVWMEVALNGVLNGVGVSVANFSQPQHVESNQHVLLQTNIPIDLLSYDREIASPPFDSHGQKVYSNGRGYITPDIDEHNTRMGWKKFDLKGNRLGTYDADLNWIKK